MATGKKEPGRKHVPQRTCVICRQVRPKRELTRLVRTPDAGILIDPTGKRGGRGAYLCDDPACWREAARGDRLNDALRTTLTDEERELIAAHGMQLASRTKTNQE
jgi:predicted RNA-binding protein YlxR (DUF448 family)